MRLIIFLSLFISVANAQLISQPDFRSYVPIEDSLSWIVMTDPHSASNANLGGQSNPIQFALTALPRDVRVNADHIFILGDFWNAGFITPTYGANVAAEIRRLGPYRVWGVEGNHDWYNDLFNTYIDPFGVNTATSFRSAADFTTQPVGDRRAYYLKNGNVLNVMIGDNQNFASPQGESSADFGSKSYNASGGFSEASWRWLVHTVLANQDCNIIVYTHHGLKNTTAGTGFLESITAGLAWIDPTTTATDFEVFRGTYVSFIENVLSENVFYDFFTAVGPSLVGYFHGHAHTQIDETIGGRTWYESVYGTKFVNMGVTNDKVFNSSYRTEVTANSKVVVVKEDSLYLKSYVQITDGIRATGYQADINKTIPLKFRYNKSYVSASPSTPSTPSITSIDVSTTGEATLHLDKGSADGLLVVRKTGGYATFTPDTSYVRGDAAGDGTVVYMGSVEDFTEYGLFGDTHYFSVFAFNGRNDELAFSTVAQTTATVTTATTAKILSELALDGGECVTYLDSRVGVTDVSGGVSLWEDQGPNGIDFGQGTSGNRPTYASSRITFATTGSKYLSTAYNAKHYLGHSTSSWLIDVPCGFFSKVRMTDATTFRIATKVSGSNIEYQFYTTGADKLALAIYDNTAANGTAIYLTNIALTAYEGTDIYVFANYLGGRKFTWGGMKLYVYDKDFNLIAYDNLDATGSSGSYAKMRDHSIPLEIGRNNSPSPDYSDGQINGVVIKRGKIFTRAEMNYLVDNFTYGDEL